MIYDPWQQEILEAQGHVLLNKGRQIGGTLIFAHKCAEYIINNPKHQIVCVSDTLDQAENIIIMVLDYLEKNHKASIIRRGKHKATKTRIWVKGEGHIISRPVGTTGDAVRSFTGNILYVDEMSMMTRHFWVAAKAILFSTGGKIWGSSTPRGKYEKDGRQTYYYQAWLNKHSKWQIIEQDSEWVAHNRKITESWTIEDRKNAIQHLKEEKQDMSASEYAQEYLHMFMDDIAQWFDDDEIRACMTLQRPNAINKNADTALGLDVARMGDDDSAYEILELRGDHLYHVENQITQKTTLPQTFNHTKALHELYDFDKIFIESIGVGVGVFDYLMEDDDTKSVTEGVDFSQQILNKDGKTRKLTKTTRFSNLKMLMETGKLHLLDDESVFQSLKSIQYAYSDDNSGVRHLKIFGNYDHIADALSFAGWFIKSKDLNPTIYTIKV